MGYRKPSVKKSFSARTTGKIKREIKKSVNPLYGKSGMGYINDPKKAIYNKVYNKTTSSVFDTSTNYTNNDLNNFTVAELKDILRTEGLKVSGTKQELIDRLKNNAPQSTQNQKTTHNNYSADEKMICPQCNEIYIQHTHCPICHHHLEPLSQITSYNIEQSDNSSEFNSNTNGCVGCLTLFVIGIIIYAIFKIL